MRFSKSLALAASLLFPAAALAQAEPEVFEMFERPATGAEGGAGAFGAMQAQSQAALFGILPGERAGGVVVDVNAIINIAMPSSLEEAIERAMKGNPEIALAAANRRQAEMAENLTRNKVTQGVVQTYKQWQFDQRALKLAETRHHAAQITEEELLTAKESAMKSDTALQFLLGGYTVYYADSRAGASDLLPQHMGGGAGLTAGAPGTESTDAGSGGFDTAAPSGGAGLGGTRSATNAVGDIPAPGGFGMEAREWRFDEQLKQASGAVHYEALPVEALAKFLTEASKIPVIVDRQAFEASEGLMNFQINLTLDSDNLTWNEVLTAISDTHDVDFLRRDYGLLITTRNKAAAHGFGGFSGFSQGGGGGF